MSVDFNVTAEIRKDVGKGASRRLRQAGKVPGILYGAGKEAVSLIMEHNHIMHHLEHEAFYSHILNVSIDGKAQKAVLKDVQRHPAKPVIMHVDFLRVSETNKIHMHVPLHFINGDIAPGVKIDGGLVSHLMSSVDIVCLAKDLPEFLEVDLANMKVGESLHLSDIKLPQGVEIPALAQGPDHDLPVVSIHVKKAGLEEEVKPAVVAEAAAPETPSES
ncbi:MAG: 50S ribosomal protein L25/general stress protein Ctc [Gammaproteobacteria bacterium]|nr:50S ribosomal protein L25/general stress protein Ctc [Gammaproteobacteria bacterium]